MKKFRGKMRNQINRRKKVIEILKKKVPKCLAEFIFNLSLRLELCENIDKNKEVKDLIPYCDGSSIFYINKENKIRFRRIREKNSRYSYKIRIYQKFLLRMKFKLYTFRLDQRFVEDGNYNFKNYF